MQRCYQTCSTLLPTSKAAADAKLESHTRTTLHCFFRAQLCLLSELASTASPALPPAALFALRLHACCTQLLDADPVDAGLYVGGGGKTASMWLYSAFLLSPPPSFSSHILCSSSLLPRVLLCTTSIIFSEAHFSHQHCLRSFNATTHAAHDFVLQVRVYAADSHSEGGCTSAEEGALSDLCFALFVARVAIATHAEVCRVILDGVAAAASESPAAFAQRVSQLVVATLLDAALMERNASCVGLMLEHPRIGLLALADQLSPPNVPTAAVAAVSTSAARAAATTVVTDGIAAVSTLAKATVGQILQPPPPAIQQAALEALLTLRLRSSEAASFPLSESRLAGAIQPCAEMLAKTHTSVTRTAYWLAESLANSLLLKLGTAPLEPPLPTLQPNSHVTLRQAEPPTSATLSDDMISDGSALTLTELLSLSQPRNKPPANGTQLLATARPLAPAIVQTGSLIDSRKAITAPRSTLAAETISPSRQRHAPTLKHNLQPLPGFHDMVRTQVKAEKQSREQREARKRAAKAQREALAQVVAEGDAVGVLAPEVHD